MCAYMHHVGLWLLLAPNLLCCMQVGSYVGRPLNSHGFTVCHRVSLLFSWSHSRFFISHGFSYKFLVNSLSNSQFPKKSNKATQHSPLSKKHCSILLYIQKDFHQELSWK